MLRTLDGVASDTEAANSGRPSVSCQESVPTICIDLIAGYNMKALIFTAEKRACAAAVIAATPVFLTVGLVVRGRGDVYECSHYYGKDK